MADEKPVTRPIGNTGGYKEGVHNVQRSDGSTHETKWYSNDFGSSRTSRDISSSGEESDKHTKKNR